VAREAVFIVGVAVFPADIGLAANAVLAARTEAEAVEVLGEVSSTPSVALKRALV
jgi:hypothetical protein